jgi:phosphoribosylanthranilate isomerase
MEVSQALEAASAGADFLGLVFAKSRRQVTQKQAIEIIQMIQALKSSNGSLIPEITGVFVNTPSEYVNYIAEVCRLDRVQLSGDETWQYCQSIERPVIKVLHIREDSTAENIINNMKNGYDLIPQEKLVCMLDSGFKGAYGGTGKTFDRKLAKEVSARFPMMIAGGITPENVKQLVEEVNPWGVDVSSGVETEGKKDCRKIRDFIRAVKD